MRGIRLSLSLLFVFICQSWSQKWASSTDPVKIPFHGEPASSQHPHAPSHLYGISQYHPIFDPHLLISESLLTPTNQAVVKWPPQISYAVPAKWIYALRPQRPPQEVYLGLPQRPPYVLSPQGHANPPQRPWHPGTPSKYSSPQADTVPLNIDPPPGSPTKGHGVPANPPQIPGLPDIPPKDSSPQADTVPLNIDPLPGSPPKGHGFPANPPQTPGQPDIPPKDSSPQADTVSLNILVDPPPGSQPKGHGLPPYGHPLTYAPPNIRVVPVHGKVNPTTRPGVPRVHGDLTAIPFPFPQEFEEAGED